MEPGESGTRSSSQLLLKLMGPSARHALQKRSIVWTAMILELLLPKT